MTEDENQHCSTTVMCVPVCRSVCLCPFICVHVYKLESSSTQALVHCIILSLCKKMFQQERWCTRLRHRMLKMMWSSFHWTHLQCHQAKESCFSHLQTCESESCIPIQSSWLVMFLFNTLLWSCMRELKTFKLCLINIFSETCVCKTAVAEVHTKAICCIVN